GGSMVHLEPDRALLFSTPKERQEPSTRRKGGNGGKTLRVRLDSGLMNNTPLTRSSVLKGFASLVLGNPARQKTVRLPNLNRTLSIMAKAPSLGMLKTRLTQTFPVAAVTGLYRCLLLDTLGLAQSLPGVKLAIMCPNSDREDLTHFLRNKVQVVAQ